MQNLGQTASLWALFVLQAFCAVFFALDAFKDLAGAWLPVPTIETDAFEYLVAFALVLGVLFTGREINRLSKRELKMRDQLAVASGAFSEVLDQHFDAWQLSPSERDVALLAIKGLSIADIAKVRDTKEGTVKAQSASIYRKAGVSGRLQLISLFIEDLMGEQLVPSTP